MNAALPPSSFGLRRGPDEALAKSDGPLHKTLNLNTRSTPNQLSRHGLGLD